MRTIELDQSATVGDTVYLDGCGWTVSQVVWLEQWQEPTTLEPVEPELRDTFCPRDWWLYSNREAPRTVYPSGRPRYGAARLETTGRAIVKKNGARWLRCRLELWDMETTKTLRGLVRLD